MFGAVGNGVSLFMRRKVMASSLLLRRRMGSAVHGSYETGFEYVPENLRGDQKLGISRGSYSMNSKYYFPSPTNSLALRSTEKEKNLHLTQINVKYPRMKNRCPKIVKGKRLEQDVLTFLSNAGKRDYLVRNNGDKVSVDSLAGKHLLICCFKVPFPRTSNAAYACRSMISAYSHLVKKKKNFEMVMVAKMATAPLMAAEKEEGAFNRFFEAFPCLAIPFWDTESRDFVCKSLGLKLPDKHFAALVLDPDQVVLQTDDESFYDYGGSGFPFSDERLDELSGEEEQVRIRLDYFYRFEWDVPGPVTYAPPLLPAVSLVELLGGSDLLLSRFGDGEKMRASELGKKKCVALYLCLEGMFMHELEWMRRNCARKNLEFEVVLVHIPFYSDTASYVKAVNAALRRGELSSWWVMPVSDDWEANRRLWRLCGLAGDLPWRDVWMFVADGGSSGEIYGNDFTDTLGEQVELYPYSRKFLLDEILSRIRSITLDSVLGSDNRLSSGDSESRVMSVSELKGKNVVLYLDEYAGISKKRLLYKLMLQSHEQIQKDYPNSEIVFVPIDDKLPKRVPSIPWLALPHPAAVIQESAISQLSPNNSKEPRIIAFGDDGRVRSVRGRDRLLGDNVSHLFDDTLFREIFSGLRGYNLDHL